MFRVVILVALLVPSVAFAGVYKCTAPDGSLTFSDKPCPGQATEEVEVHAGEPTDRQREEAARVLERDRSMVDDSREARADGNRQANKHERLTITHGMTKNQVRAELGEPDFTSPTMWGYHDDPPTTVTFGISGKVTSAVRGP